MIKKDNFCQIFLGLLIAFNDSITTMKTSFMTTITVHNNDHDIHKASMTMVIKNMVYLDWQRVEGFIVIFPLKVFSKPKNIS